MALGAGHLRREDLRKVLALNWLGAAAPGHFVAPCSRPRAAAARNTHSSTSAQRHWRQLSHRQPHPLHQRPPRTPSRRKSSATWDPSGQHCRRITAAQGEDRYLTTGMPPSIPGDSGGRSLDPNHPQLRPDHRDLARGENDRRRPTVRPLRLTIQRPSRPKRTRSSWSKLQQSRVSSARIRNITGRHWRGPVTVHQPVDHRRRNTIRICHQLLQQRRLHHALRLPRDAASSALLTASRSGIPRPPHRGNAQRASTARGLARSPLLVSRLWSGFGVPRARRSDTLSSATTIGIIGSRRHGSK